MSRIIWLAFWFVFLNINQNLLLSQVNYENCFIGELLHGGSRSNYCSDNKPLNNSLLYQNTYAQMAHWIPGASFENITVKIAFHVFNDDYGNGTDYPDNSNTLDEISQMMIWLNSFYNNCSPSDPLSNVNDLGYTKVQFELEDRVYFYNNTPLNDNCNFGDKISHISQYHSERLQYLPILIGKSCGQFAMLPYPDFIPETTGNTVDDIEGHSWVIISGIGWVATQSLAHELAHALDLKHTYNHPSTCCPESCDQNSFDYLWDVFGTNYQSNCWHDGGFSCDFESENNTCTNNIMGGVNTGSFYYSPLQVGKMHRALSIKSVRKYVKSTTKIETPVVINEDENWDFDIALYRDIVIESGSTLTISCRLLMGDNCKIIVKPGARLLIDGGVITKLLYSKNLWRGIEVWGTSTQHQYPESNPTYQGKLEIINGGTIEYADLAVQNWKPNDYNKLGGVVVANDAVFRNNKCAVSMMIYENFSPSNPAIKHNNLSRFTNTTFTIDDDFPLDQIAFQEHVRMWAVYGVYFNNCHFSNNITSKSYYASRNRAIYTIDAGYFVGAACSTSPPIGQPCPPANLLKSSFTGFNKAIQASGAGTTKTINISQTIFDTNITGIEVSELDNFVINRSTFELGNPYPSSMSASGIVSENSSGFAIEENQFSYGSGFPYTTMGIHIENSGTQNNRTYKNQFTGLTTGQFLYGVNRHPSNALQGFQFICNKFDANTLAAVSIFTTLSNNGIRAYQGEYSPVKSAGNTFVNTPSGAFTISNSTTWPITYYHNGGTTLPTYNTANVALNYTSSTNSCPSSFGPIKGVIYLKTQMDSLATIQNDLLYNYYSLIDGGNTSNFIQTINTEWSEDVWNLRNKLMEKTPYVSQEALLTAFEKQILPNAMVLELCIANPDATKGERFIEKLSTVSPLPEYMLNYIRQNWDAKTIRTTLESEIANLATDISVLEYDYVHQQVTASEKSDSTVLDVFESSKESIQKAIDLIDFSIEQGNWNNAQSILNDALTSTNFKEEWHLLDHYSAYINFRKNLNNRQLNQLDSTEIVYLENLAVSDNKRVAGYCKNILCFFYDICYEWSENNMMKKSTTNETLPDKTLNELFYNIIIYPNPSTTYTSIQWEIYDKLIDAHYRVVDLNGREHLNGVLSSNKGEQVLDTRKLGQGVYIIGIYNNNQLKISRKLIVEESK
ncbi:MAG: T9SS type A sorting domain-containing protein [Crocinitomicaceae bacterium]|nr:T9SS type A sorting domain-containing protein [Crocinitomicaceae bacterium]